MHYRRAFVPGGSFFFTVVTSGRRPILASAEAVSILREAMRRVREARPFVADAMVVLPEHLHCIWMLPPGDTDYANRWRLIKTWFTKHHTSGVQFPPDSAPRNTPWQHRYWEHALRDETDFMRHVEYIHYNPVKHGLAVCALEWPYSSFRRYVEEGLYPADWGCDAVGLDGVGRE